MDRIKELFKNKLFVYAALGVVGIVLLIKVFKNNSVDEPIIIEPDVQPESNEELPDTSNNDLFYMLGYIQDYLNQVNSTKDVIDDQTDISKLHTDGALLNVAELTQYGLQDILGVGYYWKWDSILKTWTIISKNIIPATTTTTTTTTTNTIKKYVTVVKYTTKNPPWNSYLSGIAKHENTTVANLLKLNPSIKNANLIYVGQKIRVK